MNRELRLFLLTVALPALLLAIVGTRLIYVQWCRGHDPERLERRHEPPPPFAEQEDEHRLPPHDWEDERGKPRLPPPLLRLFSPEYDMLQSRDLTVFVCIIALALLSLVSGGILLCRAARRARLEALQQTDFVSNISHEFKTPLTTICLCAELAQDEGMDSARRKKALLAIRDESERLKRLVLAALDFSRLEKKRRAFDMRTQDVAELARDVCGVFSARFPERTFSMPEGACVACVDADAVRQILTNLLDNALQYASSGAIEVTCAADSKRATVCVADRGAGLSQSALRHAFDRFWRGDNSVTRQSGGSGLGLTIARGLARGMGGDLKAANRPEGGALFTLELMV